MPRKQAHVYGNPAEYIISALLGPLEKPDDFAAWPLHITIVPWFDIDDDGHAAAALQRAAMMTKPFQVRVGNTAYLGPLKNVEVNLIHSPEIHSLHNLLMVEIEKSGGACPFPEWIAENYNPHVTKKRHTILNEGESYEINELFLVKAPKAESQLTRRKKTVIIAKLTA